MAERGAHLSQTVAEKPSIFEVVAQESLNDALGPAFRHVFRVLAQKYPAVWGPVYRYSEEVYLWVTFWVQRHYLKHYGASFAENFYGLERASLSSTDGLMNARQKRLALIALILVPYAKNKMKRLAEEWRIAKADGALSSEVWKRRWQEFFLRLYPVGHFCVQTLQLGYFMAYVLNIAPSHTPLLHALRLTLINLTPERTEEINHKREQLVSTWSVQSLVEALSSTLVSGLEIGAFFLQFLDYWYHSPAQAASTWLTLPIPSPPSAIHAEGDKTSLCPLCKEPRQTDTVLPVSGYVFCYRCIWTHLQKNQYCPVTRLPATAASLIRIYVPN